MSAIDDLIAQLQANLQTDYTQNFRGQVETFVDALKLIQGGLTPSGPQLAHAFYAGPSAGVPAAPTFRLPTASDLAAIVTLTAGKLLFGSATGGATQDTALQWDNVNKFLGVGTAAPDAALFVSLNAAATAAPAAGTVAHFVGADGASGAATIDAFGGTASFVGRRANTTGAAPSALALNDVIAAMNCRGFGTTAYSTSRGSLQFLAAEAWTDAAQGTKIGLALTPVGSAVSATVATLDAAGNMVLNGTATAGSFSPTSATIPVNGMYLSSANTIAFSTSSARVVFINSAGIQGTLAAGAAISSGASSATVPGLIPRRDAFSTGFGGAGAGVISAIIVGAEAMRWVSTGVTRQMVAFTVGTLPAAGNAGSMAFVTDSLAPVFASVVAAGGSSFAPVYDDGSNWRWG